MTALASALGMAARRLTRQRGSWLVALVTLALGIGSATAMDAFLQALLAPGPAASGSERVARLFVADPQRQRRLATLEDFTRWRESARSFSALAALEERDVVLRIGEEPVEIAVHAVTPSFFATLPVRPVAGRLLGEQDVRAGIDDVVLLRERLARRFGEPATVVGSTVRLGGRAYSVAGVLPDDYASDVLAFPTLAQAWLPLAASGASAPDRVNVWGRLRNSASWPDARAEMAALGARPQPGASAVGSVQVVPIREDQERRARLGAGSLLGPPLLVLLIASANVSNLLLVRAARRERGMAVRAALGARPWQLAAHLLGETLPLAFGAGVLGLLVAHGGFALLRSWAPSGNPLVLDRVSGLRLDGRALAFALGLSFATPLLVGLVSWRRALRVNVIESLRSAGDRPLFGRGQYHARDLFAIVEVALAVGLVVTAAFWLRFLAELSASPFAFESHGLVVARVSSPLTGGDRPEAEELERRLIERLKAVPGVAATAAANRIPGGGRRVSVVGEGSSSVLTAADSAISSDYFETLGVPLRSGRAFGRPEAAEAVIVSEELARALWGNASSIDRRIRLADDPGWRSVVGVVAEETRDRRLRAQSRYVYRPLEHAAREELILLARMKGAPAIHGTSMRDALREVDRDAVVRVDELEALFLGRLEDSAYLVRLLGLFAAVALALATVGTFNVMAQLAGERLGEMGIRAALGARPRDLARLLIEAAAVRIGLGLGLGLLVTLAGTRVAARELLLVSAPDPWLWLRVAALIAASAFAACLAPSLRAAGADPVRLLRHD